MADTFRPSAKTSVIGTTSMMCVSALSDVPFRDALTSLDSVYDCVVAKQTCIPITAKALVRTNLLIVKLLPPPFKRLTREAHPSVKFPSNSFQTDSSAKLLVKCVKYHNYERTAPSERVLY
jgi:hypothetical protein